MTVWIAFWAGVLSFFSPCVLPLYPSYLSYITGISVSQIQQSTRSIRHILLLHSLFFLLGFSAVFYSLGYAMSWIGQFFSHHQSAIRLFGAVLLLIMGLFAMGIIRPSVLLQERRFVMPKKNWGYVGSFFVGLGFGSGWTPCLGPVLSTVLYMAAYQPARAFVHLTLYVTGFALPFLLLSFFLGQLKGLVRYAEKAMKIGGACMVLFAVLLFCDQLALLTHWLSRLFS